MFHWSSIPRNIPIYTAHISKSLGQKTYFLGDMTHNWCYWHSPSSFLHKIHIVGFFHPGKIPNDKSDKICLLLPFHSLQNWKCTLSPVGKEQKVPNIWNIRSNLPPVHIPRSVRLRISYKRQKGQQRSLTGKARIFF